MATNGKNKGGAPSIETLQGVRRAMAFTIRAMRQGKRDMSAGESLMRCFAMLAKVIEMEREHGLHAVPDAELEAELERRLAKVAPAGAEAAPLQ